MKHIIINLSWLLSFFHLILLSCLTAYCIVLFLTLYMKLWKYACVSKYLIFNYFYSHTCLLNFWKLPYPRIMLYCSQYSYPYWWFILLSLDEISEKPEKVNEEIWFVYQLEFFSALSELLKDDKLWDYHGCGKLS